jgi:hypothetical protein
MELGQQISIALRKLIDDFIHEPAYNDLHLLSPTSQNICLQMQSNLVNALHIWGDAITSDNPAVRSLSISVSIKNLQTFIEASATARELYLILPTHLIGYQDRAGKIVQAMGSMSGS